MPFAARLTVTVKYPEGHVKKFAAYQAWVGPKRVTWVDEEGVRSYVLLRHGFVVTITNGA